MVSSFRSAPTPPSHPSHPTPTPAPPPRLSRSGSSAHCEPSGVQSGRERWTAGALRVSSSSGLSEVLCHPPPTPHHRLSQRRPSKSTRLGPDWSRKPCFFFFLPPSRSVDAAAMIFFPLEGAGGRGGVLPVPLVRVTSDLPPQNWRILPSRWMETKPSSSF